MLINNIFIPVITVLSFGMSIVSAENSGVVFPPAGSTPSFSSPSQTNPATLPSYTFGQLGSQLPMAAPPVNNNFAPSQRYGNQPLQRPMPPFPMQNNNSGFPSTNSGMMPFGNNNSSNNSFGMPNNPMNNMFGGNNNSMPFFGNSNNNSMPFFGNSNNNSMPFFGNSNNNSMPFFGNNNNNRKKAWGTERNIWPDFYTDFTDEAWDTVTSGPRDLGTMPGGWRFPHISTPDPVTVSDAITNQFPPIMEEGGNMMDFSDWGIFD